MVKNLSLTFDETSALLEMSVCSGARTDESASASVLTKLAYLYREFAAEQRPVSRKPVVGGLRKAA